MMHRFLGSAGFFGSSSLSFQQVREESKFLPGI